MTILQTLSKTALLLTLVLLLMSGSTIQNTPASMMIQDVSYSFKGASTKTSSSLTPSSDQESQDPNKSKTIIDPDMRPVSATFHKTKKTVNISSVGLDDKGRMGTVEDPQTLAWYDTKGHEVQNLLLSSHRDWNGELGILYGLESWETNQQVTLTYKDGTQQTYRLSKVNVYHKDNVPENVMNLQKGDPRVTVITCTGDFHPNDEGYDKRAIAIFEPMD